MKVKSGIFMALALIIVVAITAISLGGITLFGKQYYTGILQEGGLNEGIDLAGGSTITFEAKAENVTEEEMNVVEDVMRTRLSYLGYTEARVSRLQNASRIRVEIPNIEAEEAISLLGSTAKLTFQDADGNVVLEGKDVDSASYEYGQVSELSNAEHYVSLTLNDAGREKFAKATAAAAAKAAESKNYIAICMDNVPISMPMVSETINSNTCVISGSFTQETASTLANQIKSGQLPVELEAIESSEVGAELGEGAFATSLWAALIGILLIMIFMLIFYRLPGLVADISLVGYIGLTCLIIGAFRINLSLSGIAGIILSIGMAVDANVLIFERIKEEIRNGKTVRASVDAGFKRALTAILDGNITTLIAAIVLWASGVATVQGFAITLLIGVVLSMLTAITLTRFLLNQVVGLNIVNPKAYGANMLKKADAE